MSRSPGHQKWPHHQVSEQPVRERVTVELDGELLADSRDVIRVEEDNHPVRFYFPRGDVRMQRLERSTSTSECPFKGVARYFNLNAGTEPLKDAVWTYETPYDEHQTLQNRLAFYDDKYRQIRVQVER